MATQGLKVLGVRGVTAAQHDGDRLEQEASRDVHAVSSRRAGSIPTYLDRVF
jgi:hypothetical protein